MLTFSSKKELKDKLYSLLSIKKNELLTLGINMNEDEIFDYLTENKWKNSKDLRFFQIVSDIIRLDGDDKIEKK